MKCTAVIPAYNEENTISSIIDSVKPYVDDILVVLAKNSSDGTRKIVEKKKIRCVLDNGRGKGDALRVGIKEADGDVLVFFDSDGSHIADDMPAVLKPILDGGADMVLTSRMTGGSEELHGDIPKFIRITGSMLITLIINYRFGVNITDSQNGFRAVRRDVALGLDLRSDKFDVETEMIIKCLKKGCRIVEVPSKELTRKHGNSGINLWKMWYRYVWRTLINLL